MVNQVDPESSHIDGAFRSFFWAMNCPILGMRFLLQWRFSKKLDFADTMRDDQQFWGMVQNYEPNNWIQLDTIGRIPQMAGYVWPKMGQWACQSRTNDYNNRYEVNNDLCMAMLLASLNHHLMDETS